MSPGCARWRARVCEHVCWWCGVYRLLLKAPQSLNIWCMSVTLLTSQADKSSLKPRFPLNNLFIFVTLRGCMSVIVRRVGGYTSQFVSPWRCPNHKFCHTSPLPRLCS